MRFLTRLKWLFVFLFLLINSSLTATLNNVPPLIQSQWHQSDPWNGRCPGSGTNRALAGSHALALAKIMKYWGYPANGTGTISYEDDNYGQLSQDLSLAINWSGMSNTLAMVTTEKFIYTCGVAIYTDYESDFSSSSLSLLMNALIDNFYYFPSIQHLSRASYTNEQWKDTIRADLNSNCPVVYAITTSANHEIAFIIDGCYEDGSFHANFSDANYPDATIDLDNLFVFGEFIDNQHQEMLYGIRIDIDTPNNPTITQDGSGIQLNWDACLGVTSYNIYRSTESPYVLYSLIGQTSNTSFTPVITGDREFYRIVAISGSVESAPSDVVGFVKYSCTVGLNMVAIPMLQSVTTTADLGEQFGDGINTISSWNSSSHQWDSSVNYSGVFWDPSYPIGTGSIMFINTTMPFTYYCVGALPATNTQYNITLGNNVVMVPLDKSDLNTSFLVGASMGNGSDYVTSVSSWNSASQLWDTSFCFEGLWDFGIDYPTPVGTPLFIDSGISFLWPENP